MKNFDPSDRFQCEDQRCEKSDNSHYKRLVVQAQAREVLGKIVHGTSTAFEVQIYAGYE